MPRRPGKMSSAGLGESAAAAEVCVFDLRAFRIVVAGDAAADETGVDTGSSDGASSGLGTEASFSAGLSTPAAGSGGGGDLGGAGGAGVASVAVSTKAPKDDAIVSGVSASAETTAGAVSGDSTVGTSAVA